MPEHQNIPARFILIDDSADSEPPRFADNGRWLNDYQYMDIYCVPCGKTQWYSDPATMLISEMTHRKCSCLADKKFAVGIYQQADNTAIPILANMQWTPRQNAPKVRFYRI